MSMQTAFQGEVQFRRYSDTSTQGQQVVFAVADREALESFIGKEGKRFMAVLVEIGDDEEPVPSSVSNGGWSPAAQSANSRSANEQPVAGNPASANVEKSHIQPVRLGDLAWRAVQWCKEPEFWYFLNLCTSGDVVDTEEKASRRVKFMCNVGSRKDIDGSPDAIQRFHAHIRGPYQKHLMARGIN